MHECDIQSILVMYCQISPMKYARCSAVIYSIVVISSIHSGFIRLIYPHYMYSGLLHWHEAIMFLLGEVTWNIMGKIDRSFTETNRKNPQKPANVSIIFELWRIYACVKQLWTVPLTKSDLGAAPLSCLYLSSRLWSPPQTLTLGRSNV